jgi:hypothetical protein
MEETMSPVFKKLNLKNQTEILILISGWTPLDDAGFEIVSRVAIDEDWSAKRFRRVDFIKNMTRDFGCSWTYRSWRRPLLSCVEPGLCGGEITKHFGVEALVLPERRVHATHPELLIGQANHRHWSTRSMCLGQPIHSG